MSSYYIPSIVLSTIRVLSSSKKSYLLFFLMRKLMHRCLNVCYHIYFILIPNSILHTTMLRASYHCDVRIKIWLQVAELCMESWSLVPWELKQEKGFTMVLVRLPHVIFRHEGRSQKTELVKLELGNKCK